MDKEKLIEYLQHKPDCYKMQDWSEAEQALGDTPDMFRDSDYYTAVDELINKRNTCTCGLDFILTSLTAPVDGKEEESIKCPYCNDGYTPEHTNHLPEEPCVECPIFVPCGYCYGSGRVTTKLMKEHIEFDKASKYLNDDGLPF